MPRLDCRFIRILFSRAGGRLFLFSSLEDLGSSGKGERHQERLEGHPSMSSCETRCVLGSVVDKPQDANKKSSRSGGRSSDRSLVDSACRIAKALKERCKTQEHGMCYDVHVYPSLTFTRASLQCWHRYSVHQDIITLPIWRLCLDLTVFSS